LTYYVSLLMIKQEFYNTIIFDVCCILPPCWHWKLCHYQALDRFSCNSIARRESPGMAKTGRGKRPGCHRPGGKRPGEHVQRGNVLHPKSPHPILNWTHRFCLVTNRSSGITCAGYHGNVDMRACDDQLKAVCFKLLHVVINLEIRCH